MKTPFIALPFALVAYVSERETFDWECASGAGSMQSCNNACFAVNCVARFDDTTTYFMDRPNEPQRRRDSGQRPWPYPCNNAWGGSNRWRAAGDRTSGGMRATDLDEFPFASTSNGGRGARLRCVNLSDNRSAGAKFGAFLTSVGWGDASLDGTSNRDFGIFISNWDSSANYCNDTHEHPVDCTNDGAEFHKDGANFVDGKRHINMPRYEEDITPAKPVYKMRKFMGSDGKERLLLGRDNGTLPFEVGHSAEKQFKRDDGESFSILYEITA